MIRQIIQSVTKEKHVTSILQNWKTRWRGEIKRKRTYVRYISRRANLKWCRTSATTNSWTTPLSLSWTVTLWVGIEGEPLSVRAATSTAAWSSVEVVFRRHFKMSEKRRFRFVERNFRKDSGFRFTERKEVQGRRTSIGKVEFWSSGEWVQLCEGAVMR